MIGEDGWGVVLQRRGVGCGSRRKAVDGARADLRCPRRDPTRSPSHGPPRLKPWEHDPFLLGRLHLRVPSGVGGLLGAGAL